MAWARKLRSGRFQPQYYDPAGRVKSTGETFLRKADAIKAAAVQEALISVGKWADPSRGNVPFDGYCAKWLEAKRFNKPKTFTDYETVLRLHLIPFFGRQQLRTIDRARIQNWVTWMESKGAGAAVVRKAYRVLRAIFNDAVPDELDHTPVRKVSLPEAPKRRHIRIVPADVMLVANAIVPRFRAPVLLGGMLGLRWAEIAGLQYEDLDLDNERALIRRTISEDKGLLHFTDTKNHREQPVPLPKLLCDLLEQHMKLFVAAPDSFATVHVNGVKTKIPTETFVVTTEGGGLFRRNAYARHFKPAVVAAGLNPKITFHDLRKAAGSIAASPTYANGSPKSVQNLLRHSSQQVTTEVYVTEFAEDFDALRDNLQRIYTEAGPPVRLQCEADSTVPGDAPANPGKVA